MSTSIDQSLRLWTTQAKYLQKQFDDADGQMKDIVRLSLSSLFVEVDRRPGTDLSILISLLFVFGVSVPRSGSTTAINL